jgi:hypothetical protein
MMIEISPSSPAFILGNVLFILSNYDSAAEAFMIYAKEPVSIQTANEFVLEYQSKKIILFIEGNYYTASPSMKMLPSTEHPTRNAVLLRLRVEKPPLKAQSDYEAQFGLKSNAETIDK